MSVIKPQLKQQNKVKGKGGGNKGSGKGGKQQQGGWVFIPATPAWGGKGKSAIPAWGGKGFGKQSFGKQAFVPMAKGFGKGGKDDKHRETMNKLGKIEADRKVWVGGLQKDTTWKKLEKHFKELDCRPSTTEIMAKGSACCAFKTAEEASSALAIVNGTELDGQTIEVDVWTKKEKKEGEERPQKSVEKKVKKKSVAKQNKMSSKMTDKIKAVDNSQKVWVGGLKPTTSWKEVKQHFVDNGCEIDMCDIPKPGRACVTFATAEEATSAIASLNGTELDGNTIEVDVWTKIEKKKKEEA